jgi:hypothetical protein
LASLVILFSRAQFRNDVTSWWRGHVLDISRRSRRSSTQGCPPNPQPIERILAQNLLSGVMIEADRTIVPFDPLHHLGITPVVFIEDQDDQLTVTHARWKAHGWLAAPVDTREDDQVARRKGVKRCQ